MAPYSECEGLWRSCLAKIARCESALGKSKMVKFVASALFLLFNLEQQTFLLEGVEESRMPLWLTFEVKILMKTGGPATNEFGVPRQTGREQQS